MQTRITELLSSSVFKFILKAFIKIQSCNRSIRYTMA